MGLLVKHWLGYSAALMLSACASRSGIDHTVALSNAGQAVVYDFQVHYGAYDFPKHPLERFDHGGGGNYAITIPVPDVATVQWRTHEGRTRTETVALRKAIEDKSWFDGDGKFIFEVEGTELRVYIVRSFPNFKEERSQIQ